MNCYTVVGVWSPNLFRNEHVFKTPQEAKEFAKRWFPGEACCLLRLFLKDGLVQHELLERSTLVGERQDHGDWKWTQETSKS